MSWREAASQTARILAWVRRVDQAAAQTLERLATHDPNRIPPLAWLPEGSRLLVVLLIWLIALLLVAFFATYSVIMAVQWERQLALVSHLQPLAQRYAEAVQRFTEGQEDAYQVMQQTERAISEELAKYGEDSAIWSSSMQRDIARINQSWLAAKQPRLSLLQYRDTLFKLKNALVEIDALQIELLALVRQAKDLSRGAKRQAYDADHLAMLVKRLTFNAKQVLHSESNVKLESAYRISEDLRLLREGLEDIFNTSADLEERGASNAIARIRRLQEVFTGFEQRLNIILGGVPHLIKAAPATRVLTEATRQMQSSLATLSRRAPALPPTTSIGLTIFFAVWSMVTLFSLAWILSHQTQQRMRKAMAEASRSQEAIMRMINELDKLAEGDISVRLTVSEDITGTLADSINSLIELMQRLIDEVNTAVVVVTEVAAANKQLSEVLNMATLEQARQFAHSHEFTQEMARLNANIFHSVDDLALAAVQSEEKGTKGMEAVQASLAGMNQLSEKLFAVDQGIKRLRNTTKQLSDLAQSISDFTAKTNVLALNAAIQATAAGEAGRGFAVMVDEVQRFAERSANTAQRVGAIAKVLESDCQALTQTQQAITLALADGVNLLKQASEALIELVSNFKQINEHTQGIRAMVGEYKAKMDDVIQGMQDVLPRVQEAVYAHNRLAESIRRLTAQSEALQGIAVSYRRGSDPVPAMSA